MLRVLNCLSSHQCQRPAIYFTTRKEQVPSEKEWSWREVMCHNKEDLRNRSLWANRDPDHLRRTETRPVNINERVWG